MAAAILPATRRILGVVLEVPPAQRVAVRVQRGAQQHVHAVFVDLVAHGAPDLLEQFHVPRRGQQRLDRKRRAVEGARVAVPLGLDAQPRRAVRQDDGGNAQAGNGTVVPAAPGTPLMVSPTAGAFRSSPRSMPGSVMPAPTTRLTFSSVVMAASTSFVGLLPNWGGSAGLHPTIETAAMSDAASTKRRRMSVSSFPRPTARESRGRCRRTWFSSATSSGVPCAPRGPGRSSPRTRRRAPAPRPWPSCTSATA